MSWFSFLLQKGVDARSFFLTNRDVATRLPTSAASSIERISVEISDTSFQLHDGRTLAYAEYGVSSRNVLFYFHGGADSPLEARLLAPAATHTGIRLIGVDRPGMGRSSFQKGRRVCDWPDDIVELADYLHIDHFAVVGISGGGPYALACASKIPDRLIACGIVGGEWHQRHALSSLTQFLPWLVTPVLGSFFAHKNEPKKRCSA